MSTLGSFTAFEPRKLPRHGLRENLEIGPKDEMLVTLLSILDYISLIYGLLNMIIHIE